MFMVALARPIGMALIVLTIGFVVVKVIKALKNKD